MAAIQRLAKIWDWAKPSKKHIYFFHEGSATDTSLLGNKGAHLCEMHRMGLPVPPGWIITTEACLEFLKSGHKFDDHTLTDMRRSLHELELVTGKSFDPSKTSKQQLPLLLSIRSGAAVSMPGMMSTVLNVGVNDDVVETLARITNNRKWAYDTQRRFLQMFGQVVLGVNSDLYEEVLSRERSRLNVAHESDFTEQQLKIIVEEFKKIASVPDNPWVQMLMSIEAVFMSWNSPRALKYRDLNNISSELGTGVVVQSMVFGNMNDVSGSGVAFSRNPATGEKGMYGEYLPNAEGEDVVGGIRTPMKLQDLCQYQPSVFDALQQTMHELEQHYCDMQDVEFTVENGILYILQTRTGKRSPLASLRIAVEMVKDKMISEREALLRVQCFQLRACQHPMLSPEFCNAEKPNITETLLTKGLAASGGAATGPVVFQSQEAERLAEASQKCILCKEFTSADDISGLNAATGVLTSRGGLTSHASVVMRGMDKPAVVGAKDIVVDSKRECITTKDGKLVVKKGDVITVDGSTGLVFVGAVPMVTPMHTEEFQTVLRWADKYKRMQVFANADSAEDVEQAIELGAEGIGLCRTEHMFFKPDRLDIFRQLLLTETEEGRKDCLRKILVLQRHDFLELFRSAENHEVIIRLLDAPTHEFLPSQDCSDYDEQIDGLAKALQIDVVECRNRIRRFSESNPMLGCRGCRQAIVHPDVVVTQTRAIIEAYIAAHREGIHLRPQIMIPLVFSDHEINELVPIISSAATDAFRTAGHNIDSIDAGCDIGAMIELPRACIRAEKIATAPHISFVSFGTNDLTQTVFGISRDDTQQFMPLYMEKHLVAKDPFVSLDLQGVGAMIQLAVSKIRSSGSTVQIGVCGEHAADQASIAFFNSIGVDYISCSKFDIPTAKLAAAQAHIKDTTGQRDAWPSEVWNTAKNLLAQY